MAGRSGLEPAFIADPTLVITGRLRAFRYQLRSISEHAIIALYRPLVILGRVFLAILALFFALLSLSLEGFSKAAGYTAKCLMELQDSQQESCRGIQDDKT